MSRRIETSDVELLPEHIQQQIRDKGGPQKGKPMRRLEQELQINCVDYFDRQNFPEWLWQYNRWLAPPAKIGEYIHHTPNGGGRSKAEGGIFKAMGLRAGYPDLSLDITLINGPEVWAGWDCELKIGNEKPRPNQLEWFERLTRVGHKCDVARSLEECEAKLMAYLKLGTPFYRGWS